MTVEEVYERLEVIRRWSADDEAAHGAEEDLWKDVLTAISQGAENAVDLSRAALQTLNFDFARWYS